MADPEQQRRALLEDHAPQDFCVSCPFGGPKVGSKGDPKSPIVFVAESPGLDEVKAGEPLVGQSGQIFHKFVPREGVYILNAMECRPSISLKNEAKLNVAAQCCRDHLLDKITLHPRRIIIAMGNPAVRSLTGNFGLKITQIRGRLIPSEFAELGIFPMVHIAALMRGTGSFRQWKQDIAYALELGAGGSPIEHIPGKAKIWPEGWLAMTSGTEQEAIDELFATRIGKEPTADIETTGFNHRADRILSVGITPAHDPGISYCFYPRHLPFLRPYFEDPAYSWCWHNGKFDVKFLRAAGVKARTDEDTMLMSYTLDESGGIHDLETVSADVLGAPDYKHMIKPWLPNKDASYELVPPDVLANYQAIDTCNTAQIRPIYRNRIRRQADLEKLYTETLLPASEMLAQVEWNGIRVDPERLDENEEYFAKMKANIGAEINEMIGYSINAGSPQQVSRLLYRHMKFPNRRKGSTDEKAIKWLQQKTEHPIFALILKHRKAVKMYGTYVKGIRKHVHTDTLRVYPTVLVHGTRTGRLACRNPNLQNPPRDPQIRGTFVASPEHELVEVDLSQAELRSLACLSGDPTLCQVFLDGQSPHKDLSIYLSSVGSFTPDWETRYAAYQADPGNPSLQLAKEEYTKSKNVNFGIMYGIIAFGLMEQIKDTRQAAQELLNGWAERYNVAAEFQGKCRDTARKNQVLTTCFGRKKRVGIVTRQNLHFLENEAANFPHQSIASDITLHAAIRTWRPLLKMGVRIVMLIHDAILMEVPITAGNTIREEAIELVRREMAQVPRDYGIKRVPFESEGEVGHRWGSLQEPHDLEEAA